MKAEYHAHHSVREIFDMSTWDQIVYSAVWLSAGSMVIPLLMVIYLSARRTLNPELLSFAWLIVFWNYINTCSVFESLHRHNNYWFFHIMIPVEFAILISLLIKWGSYPKPAKIILWLLVGVVTIEQLFFSNYSKLGEMGVIIAGLTLVALSLYNSTAEGAKSFQRIITLSISIYYSIGTPSLLAMNEMIANQQYKESLIPFFIYSIINVISNSLYTWGLICRK